MRRIDRKQVDEMQLDLFAHSRDVVLRNRAIEAARGYDKKQLESAIELLAAECPADPLLAALRTLLERICVSLPPGLSRAAALQMVRLTEQTSSAAERVFGNMAERWLAQLWDEIATAIGDLSFDPSSELIHAAPLFLRAGSWVKANESIKAIPAWRHQPVPLAWKVESEFHQSGLISAWPYFAELCWMAPSGAASLAARLEGDELGDLLRHFQMQYEGDGDELDFAWLPAWSVIAEPRWAASLRLAQPGKSSPAERFARQLLELLTLERHGRHTSLVAGRRILRDINPALFALYMRTR